jgi:hypothetical protein
MYIMQKYLRYYSFNIFKKQFKKSKKNDNKEVYLLMYRT